MIGWMDNHQGAVTAFSTILLAIITGIYVWLTKRSVQELRQQRMDSALPVIWFDWINVSGKRVLHVTNRGPGMALYVDVDLTYHSINAYGEDLGPHSKKDKIGALDPKGQVSTELIEKSTNRISADAYYKDIHGRSFFTCQAISINEPWFSHKELSNKKIKAKSNTNIYDSIKASWMRLFRGK